MKPETGGQFEALETWLTKTFGLKRHERAALIIDYPDIGDGSAMKLADNYMRLHDEDDSMLLRELFLRHLPAHVRARRNQKPSGTRRACEQNMKRERLDCCHLIAIDHCCCLETRHEEDHRQELVLLS